MTVLDRSQASECINATNLLSFGSSRAFPNSSNLGAPPCPSGLERLVLRSLQAHPSPRCGSKSMADGSSKSANLEGTTAGVTPRNTPYWKRVRRLCRIFRPPPGPEGRPTAPYPSVPRPDRFGRRPFGSEPTIHIPELGPLSSLVIERRIRQVCEGNWSPKFCLAKVPISPG
jgi:hypothetical protein